MTAENLDLKSMLSGFMDNAKKMQENFSTAYQELAQKHQERTVEGAAGGDMVLATVNLKLEVQRIDFGPDFLNEKPEVISELIAAAVNQALHKAQTQVKQEMVEMTKKMGLPTNVPMPFGE